MKLEVEHTDVDDTAKAVEKITDSFKEEEPDLLYVFASYSYDMEKIAEVLTAKYDETEIVGCSSAVEVSSQGVNTESLVIAAISGVEVGTGIGKHIGEDSYASGSSAIKEAAENLNVVETEEDTIKVDDLKRESIIVNVFADPLNGVGIDILEAINDYLGQGFNVAGQFAADNLEFEETFVLHNGEVYNDAVVVSMFDTSENVGLNKAHGFQKMPQQYEVKESDKNIVRDLGGQKPAEIYGDLFGEDQAKDPGFLLMTPFGMDVGAEEPEIRVTIDVDDEGCFVCGASVPEQEEVTLLRGEKQKMLEAATKASQKAREDAHLEKDQTEAAFIFSCVGRHAIYNDEEITAEEVQNVKDQLGEDTEVIGLYGFGQIATTNGYARFNEETMVVQIMGRDNVEI